MTCWSCFSLISGDAQGVSFMLIQFLAFCGDRNRKVEGTMWVIEFNPLQLQATVMNLSKKPTRASALPHTTEPQSTR